MFRHFLILCLFSVTMQRPVEHVSLEDGATVRAGLEEDGELAIENTASLNLNIKMEVTSNLEEDKVPPGWIRVLLL